MDFYIYKFLLYRVFRYIAGNKKQFFVIQFNIYTDE